MYIRNSFLVISLLVVVNHVSAQLVQLDTSFNHTGKLFTNIAGVVSSSIAQPDGKILIGGSGKVNQVSRNAICRLMNDGSFDISFGTNGILYDSFYHSQHDQINSLLLQPDGKIIAIGRSDSFINFNISVARYLANGTIDNSFGTNGKILLPQTIYGSSVAAALQLDGKIILAGSNAGFCLIRLLSNGIIDSSFGNYGVVVSHLGTANYGGGEAIVIQPDGKIIVGGKSYHNTFYWAALGRYNSNGTLDNTFGTNGIVEISVRGYYDEINYLLLQPDGKIIATGNSTINSSGSSSASTAYLIMRLDSVGNLDNSFNSNGKLVKALGNRDDKCFKAILQSDGKIIIGGYTTNANINLDFAMYRATSSGADDITFGGGGAVTGNFIFNSSNFNDRGQTICMQPNGKLVVAGYSALSGAGSFAAMRFNNNYTTGVQLPLNILSHQLIIYPNPCHQSIAISQLSLMNATIKLINLTGQTLIEKQNQSGSYFNLDISEQTNGIYFLEIKENANVWCVKVVKE